jgi:hypothetical protein
MADPLRWWAGVRARPPDCAAYFVFFYTKIHGIDSFKFMQGGVTPPVSPEKS